MVIGNRKEIIMPWNAFNKQWIHWQCKLKWHFFKLKLFCLNSVHKRVARLPDHPPNLAVRIFQKYTIIMDIRLIDRFICWTPTIRIAKKTRIPSKQLFSDFLLASFYSYIKIILIECTWQMIEDPTVTITHHILKVDTNRSIVEQRGRKWTLKNWCSIIFQ